MLEEVVVLSLGPSKGPDMMIFKRLQSGWEAIDRSTNDAVTSYEISYSAVFCVAS